MTGCMFKFLRAADCKSVPHAGQVTTQRYRARTVAILSSQDAAKQVAGFLNQIAVRAVG